MTKQSKADMALLLVTIGWGASFILTKNVLGELDTFNFIAVRFLIAFALSSVIFIKEMRRTDLVTVKYAFVLSVLLFGTFAFQTMGLNYTTTSKSAFITGFNVLLVPVFSALLIRKLPEKKVVFSVIAALFGLGLLTLDNGMGNINIGDLLTLACAIIFAFYIILLGKYTVKAKSIPLAILQFGFVGVMGLVTSFLVETPTLPQSAGVWINILLLSVVCTCCAYIVQSVAQKYTTPTHTALIFTGEPVFAAGFAYLMLGETLSISGVFGAFLIVASMLITEIDFKKLKRVNDRKDKSNQCELRLQE